MSDVTVQIHWPSMRVDTLPSGSPVPRVGESVEVWDTVPLTDGRRGVRRIIRRGVVARVSYELDCDASGDRRFWAQVTMRRA